MKLFNVSIEGVSPLLQHRFSEQSQAGTSGTTRRVNLPQVSPREAAEQVAYRDSQGILYFPGAAIARLLREAGSAHKQRSSRRSLKYIIPSSVIVTDEAIRLVDTETKSPLKDFEVDGRPVTIPATKGRIMRYRPRLDRWAAEFSLRVNEDIIPEEMVHQLLTEGGMQLGIGDFRPEKGGPFGTFRVTNWSKK